MSMHSASAMSHGIAFSSTYASAQSSFLDAAHALGRRLESYALDPKGPEGESLVIDVAVLGDLSPQQIIVISSGLHGVEGFFGSAVQCRLLRTSKNGNHYPAKLLFSAMDACFCS